MVPLLHFSYAAIIDGSYNNFDRMHAGTLGLTFVSIS